MYVSPQLYVIWFICFYEKTCKIFICIMSREDMKKRKWSLQAGLFFSIPMMVFLMCLLQWNQVCINHFPHIDAFWRLCSRQLFEKIVTKEEIAQNEQFLLLSQCFPLLIIGYPFNYSDFLYFYKICSKSSAAELLYEGKG